MSNLLERAIIDAKALKEAALRNAEQLVIEKYSEEVKKAMTEILEEAPEDELGAADPFGDPATEQTSEEDQGPTLDPITAEIPDAFNTDDDEVIQIKLDSLDAELDDEEGPFAGDDELEDDEIGIDITDDEPDLDTDLDTEYDVDASSDFDSSGDIGVDITGPSITPEALEEIISDTIRDTLSEEDLDEELDLEESDELDEEIDLDELMERVRIEGEPQKSGWAGTPESIMQEYESMLLAREQDSEIKEKNAELRKTVAELQKENKTLSSAALKLQKQNKKFNAAFSTLQEKLETMNVSNAKLLYINQALENASLNERQKRKIVEAISKAETVQEAKIMFETLNETVTTTSDVKKKATLSEMVSRKSSLLVAARKEQPKQDANPLFSRMQTLAGIKTK